MNCLFSVVNLPFSHTNVLFMINWKEPAGY